MFSHTISFELFSPVHTLIAIRNEMYHRLRRRFPIAMHSLLRPFPQLTQRSPSTLFVSSTLYFFVILSDFDSFLSFTAFTRLDGLCPVSFLEKLPNQWYQSICLRKKRNGNTDILKNNNHHISSSWWLTLNCVM